MLNVGVVTRDSAADVFAALSERVCERVLEYFEFGGFPNLLLYAFAKNSSAWIEGFEVGVWHV